MQFWLCQFEVALNSQMSRNRRLYRPFLSVIYDAVGFSMYKLSVIFINVT